MLKLTARASSYFLDGNFFCFVFVAFYNQRPQKSDVAGLKQRLTDGYKQVTKCTISLFRRRLWPIFNNDIDHFVTCLQHLLRMGGHIFCGLLLLIMLILSLINNQYRMWKMRRKRKNKHNLSQACQQFSISKMYIPPKLEISAQLIPCETQPIVEFLIFFYIQEAVLATLKVVI